MIHDVYLWCLSMWLYACSVYIYIHMHYTIRVFKYSYLWIGTRQLRIWGGFASWSCCISDACRTTSQQWTSRSMKAKIYGWSKPFNSSWERMGTHGNTGIPTSTCFPWIKDGFGNLMTFVTPTFWSSHHNSMTEVICGYQRCEVNDPWPKTTTCWASLSCTAVVDVRGSID